MTFRRVWILSAVAFLMASCSGSDDSADASMTADTSSVTDTPAPADTPMVTDVTTDTAVEPDTGIIAQCSGSCPEEGAILCLQDGSSACFCDDDYLQWVPVQCATYCEHLGGTGTLCINTEHGPDCDCAFTCDDWQKVGKQCDRGIWTECTCAATDPCGWDGDDLCDSTSCNELYPDQDNFDDSDTDC